MSEQGTIEFEETVGNCDNQVEVVRKRGLGAREVQCLGIDRFRELRSAFIDHEIRSLASALAGLGLGPGDTVGLALRDGPVMAVAFLGASAVAAAAPLNPRIVSPARETGFVGSCVSSAVALSMPRMNDPSRGKPNSVSVPRKSRPTRPVC